MSDPRKHGTTTKRTKKSSKVDPRSKRDKRWVSKVKTVSTYPPRDLFTKDGRTIAKVMATKKVSPKGIGSAIRMVQYFLNRGGKGLSSSRKRELEKAKEILRGKLRNEKGK